MILLDFCHSRYAKSSERFQHISDLQILDSSKSIATLPLASSSGTLPRNHFRRGLALEGPLARSDALRRTARRHWHYGSLSSESPSDSTWLCSCAIGSSWTRRSSWAPNSSDTGFHYLFFIWPPRKRKSCSVDSFARMDCCSFS